MPLELLSCTLVVIAFLVIHLLNEQETEDIVILTEILYDLQVIFEIYAERAHDFVNLFLHI